MFSVYHTLLASISQRRSKGTIMLFFFKNGSWELFATRQQSIALFMKIFTFRQSKNLGKYLYPPPTNKKKLHSFYFQLHSFFVFPSYSFSY